MRIPDGRCLFTASCRIRTKLPSGRRTPLYILFYIKENFTQVLPYIQSSICFLTHFKFIVLVTRMRILTANKSSLVIIKVTLKVYFSAIFKSHQHFSSVYMLAEMQDDQDFLW